MNKYFATFIPGFGEVIETKIKKDFGDVQILKLLGSSIIFTTNTPHEKVIRQIYFNNVFLVLAFSSLDKNKQNGTLVKTLFKLSDEQSVRSIKNRFPTSLSFRIMIQRGNKLVHIPSSFTQNILMTIRQQSQLTYQPLKADLEFWFFLRDEGYGIFGVKFTKNKPKKTIYKGQLQPSLAYLVNLFSDPQPIDIYLDPFAGYGALPESRLRHFEYNHIYISDNNPQLAEKLKKLMSHDRRVTVKNADSRDLSYLSNDSINKIVSDPPWGMHNMQNVDYQTFYLKMLTEMVRVLKDKGIIVLITGRIEEFKEALIQFKDQLTLVKTIATLVNGKKASVYKIIKSSL